MTTANLPALRTATAVAVRPTSRPARRQPWTVLVYVTGLAATGCLVAAALTRYAGHDTVSSWLVVATGVLLVLAFTGLSEEHTRYRNNP